MNNCCPLPQEPGTLITIGGDCKAIARRAEPLCYTGRVTRAVWLNHQIWQSYIPAGGQPASCLMAGPVAMNSYLLPAVCINRHL